MGQLFPNPIPEEYPVVRPNRRQMLIAFSIHQFGPIQGRDNDALPRKRHQKRPLRVLYCVTSKQGVGSRISPGAPFTSLRSCCYKFHAFGEARSNGKLRKFRALPTRSATSFDRRLGVGLPHATTANRKQRIAWTILFQVKLLALYDAQRSAPDCKGLSAAHASAACKQDMKKQRCLRVAAVESSWQ